MVLNSNQVLPIDAVTLLNEALQADRAAVEALFAYRVECNENLAFHPTIQVGEYFTLGFLGLLNGIFGINESMTGYICAVYEDGKLTRFMLTPDREKAN